MGGDALMIHWLRHKLGLIGLNDGLIHVKVDDTGRVLVALTCKKCDCLLAKIETSDYIYTGGFIDGKD